MNESMTSSVFPDLNVWLALSLLTHEHHALAWNWYQGVPDDMRFVFCRQTQLGFLRLMTTPAVAQDETLTQRQAWSAYDTWVQEGGAIFSPEPLGLEAFFRQAADRVQSSPKTWADAYLAAFAEAFSLRLVTFDKALAAKTKRAILLKP